MVLPATVPYVEMSWSYEAGPFAAMEPTTGDRADVTVRLPSTGQAWHYESSSSSDDIADLVDAVNEQATKALRPETLDTKQVQAAMAVYKASRIAPARRNRW